MQGLPRLGQRRSTLEHLGVIGVSLTALMIATQARAGCAPLLTTNGPDVVTCTNAVPDPSPAPQLGGGDDAALLQGGTLIGSVSGGDGNDGVTLDGATVGGSLTGDAGDDVLTVLSGSTAGMSGGDGADQIIVSGGTAPSPPPSPESTSRVTATWSVSTPPGTGTPPAMRSTSGPATSSMRAFPGPAPSAWPGCRSGATSPPVPA
jgi:hypothetical protein